jgi:transcriptional regulator
MYKKGSGASPHQSPETAMPADPHDHPEIPPGTLDLLNLQAVTRGSLFGYAIARRIKDRSGSELLVEEGSLYPALHRLVRLKQLVAEWGTSENTRRARFYRITPAGQKRLKADASARRRVALETRLDIMSNAGARRWRNA